MTLGSPPDHRQRLEAHTRQWRVTVDRVIETRAALIAFGQRDRQPVVVKVVKNDVGEWRSGEIVNAFAGRGVVRVFESDAGAVLLEQLCPGDSVMDIAIRGEDDRATAILADTIGAMSTEVCPGWVPGVADLGASFTTYLPGQDGQLGADIVSSASRTYADLCASQTNERLLHGDLHHENVLYDDARGWVAIDPKGVRGELEYEIGAALRNPCDRPDLFARPDVVTRRVERFVHTLDVDGSRVLRWAFAQAVLAAIWDLEDGVVVAANNRWLAFARAIGSLVGDPEVRRIR
jgi:streptomycin 6-kinase